MTKSSRAKRSVQLLCAISLLCLRAGLGCILPPPVAVEEQVNNEPFVVNETAKPQKAFVELNLNCKTCTFSVRVEDPDNETLFARWFLDFDTEPFVIQCGGSIAPAADVNAERQAAFCDIPLDERFRGTEDDGSVHTLEAWIADRDFVGGGRELPSDAFVAVKQWTVRVKRRGIGCDDLEQLGCKSAR
jgi:hypothetical protein